MMGVKHTSMVVAAGALALLLQISRADVQLTSSPSKDNSEQCDCYLVSGVEPGYFQYHRFWDFRNIPNDADNDFTVAPPLLTDSQRSGAEANTSAYFNTAQFQADWSISASPERPDSLVPAYDSPQNIYISRNTTSGANNSTYLTLRTQRLEKFVSSAELDSNQRNIKYSSIRGRFRVIPNYLSNSSAPAAGTDRVVDNQDAGSNASHPVDNGAVVGFFTYHSDTQESDIEILTSDPLDNIRYSNQPDYDAKKDESVPGASTQATIPQGTIWTDWVEHRIDWFDGISRWYINDQFVLDKKVNVPTTPSGFVMNVWSDGGNWSGNMSVGSTVLVGVEWIEMTFNISGSNDLNQKRAEKAKCHIGCNVDSVQTVGYPEMAYNSSSTSAASSHSLSPRGGFHVYVSGLVAAAAALNAGLFTLL